MLYELPPETSLDAVRHPLQPPRQAPQPHRKQKTTSLDRKIRQADLLGIQNPAIMNKITSVEELRASGSLQELLDCS